MPARGSSTKIAGLRVVVALEEGADRARLCAELVKCAAETCLVSTPSELWAALDAGDVDLAYIDLGYAALEPVRIVRELRAHPRSCHVPILALVGPDHRDAVPLAYEAGVTAFIAKPIDWDLLIIHQEIVVREARRVLALRCRMDKLTAACRARETIIGGACSEALGHIRAVADASAKALRSRRAGSGAGDLVSGLRAVEDMAVQIERLVVDALEVADVVGGLVDLETESHALTGIAEAAIEALREAASECNVAVRLLPQDQPEVVVACDRDALAEAITHLLGNALAHAPSESAVDIETRVHDDGMLTISITDHGPGMSPDFVMHCLDPLRSSPGAGPSRFRIGAGLPLAKAIAEAHGGKLEIRTSPRAGTCAMLVVPADRVRRQAVRGQPG